MPTPTLKTRILTNDKSTWRLTRFSDELFTAVNGFGKKHTFRSQFEVESFEDFLCRKGYSLLQRNRSLATLKKPVVA